MTQNAAVASRRSIASVVGCDHATTVTARSGRFDPARIGQYRVLQLIGPNLSAISLPGRRDSNKPWAPRQRKSGMLRTIFPQALQHHVIDRGNKDQESEPIAVRAITPLVARS